MKKIGEILIEISGLSPASVDQALKVQESQGDRLGRILIRQKEMDELDLLRALGLQFDMEVVVSLPLEISTDFTAKVSIGFLKKNRLVPMAVRNDKFIAINDPCAFQTLDDLRHILGWRGVRSVLCPYPAIVNAINFAYDMTQDSAEEVMQDIDEDDPEPFFPRLRRPAICSTIPAMRRLSAW